MQLIKKTDLIREDSLKSELLRSFAAKQASLKKNIAKCRTQISIKQTKKTLLKSQKENTLCLQLKKGAIYTERHRTMFN